MGAVDRDLRLFAETGYGTDVGILNRCADAGTYRGWDPSHDILRLCVVRATAWAGNRPGIVGCRVGTLDLRSDRHEYSLENANAVVLHCDQAPLSWCFAVAWIFQGASFSRGPAALALLEGLASMIRHQGIERSRTLV